MRKITGLAFMALCVCVFAACGGDGETQDADTTLTIKNESFTEIIEVVWQDVSFKVWSEDKISPGYGSQRSVQAGAGYIFFKRNVGPVPLVGRTMEVVRVEENQQVQFVFTDTTVIAEVLNPDNNGTLSAVQTTVV
jgi:hypothetical protein